ncbi:hypothetical protein [Ferdinandcohnia sp. SAFN-114]|uniref:hypothetical protein n=1 Tax=Ferdinandcohnia sp. SAFN-114 TaxID=3387275 RepID=UPI003F80EEF0
MTTQTVKNDWLNDWFADNNYFVSGHEKFSESLNLPEETKVSIRYVSLNKNFLWLLTIEADEGLWQQIQEILEDNVVFDFINSKFEKKMNILIFSPTKQDYFCYKKYNGKYVNMDGDKLKSAFNNVLPNIDQNVGTIKEVNKSVNDNFQIWTRESLSKFSVINDFDAVYLTKDKQSKNQLFEFKRVKQDLSTWMPYLDDSSNYNRINTISNKLGFSNYTLVYKVEEQSKFAVHTNIVPQGSQILGLRMIYDYDNEVENYKHTSTTEYVSENSLK